MGLKDSLVTMMGDFVELRRNPDFRSKTELSSTDPPDPTRFNPNRRHSLQITCGTQDAQPERLVHQRTFSVQGKVTPKETGDCTSLSQEPTECRRYKHRRASEPLNLIGLGALTGWTRGSGKRRQKMASRQQSSFDHSMAEEDSSSPADSPSGAGDPPAGRRSPSSAFGKSGGTFSSASSRFFAHHNPIEEAEEFEAEMDGQRRMSHGKRTPAAAQPVVEHQRYATVIRL